jgi:hypothetical protein
LGPECCIIQAIAAPFAMEITHRAPADASALTSTTALTIAAELALPLLPAASIDKAPRLSCCCRLSELMPMVRQLHDEARAAREATEAAPSVAA